MQYRKETLRIQFEDPCRPVRPADHDVVAGPEAQLMAAVVIGLDRLLPSVFSLRDLYPDLIFRRQHDVCGQIGVSRRRLAAGSTTGPPADIL